MTEVISIDEFRLTSPVAERTTLDEETRKRALDIRRSWIVEAPAGSGKTGLLIQRYLKLLGDDSISEPEQVLAITFTVKATSEMRERVIRELERATIERPKFSSPFDQETYALAEKVLKRDAELGWKLLETPARLKIRTIDSVSAEIARLLPILSEGGGRQAPVNDASPMYEEAARRTLMQLGGSDLELDDALRKLLLHRDVSVADCERLLVEMLPLRNQWGELVPLGHELDDTILEKNVRPRLEKTLEDIVCIGLTEFSATIPQDFLERLFALALQFAEIAPYNHPITICVGKIGLPANNASDLQYWQALLHLLVTKENTWRKRFNKRDLHLQITDQQKEALRDLIDEVSGRQDVLDAIERVGELPPASYPEEQWEIAKALFYVLNRALAELQVIFAQRRECDFTELGLLAKTVLERDGGTDELNAALGMKLEHLLVDEVQDTSTSQFHLLELLTEGWDGYSQTVFLVGDPKQSIYLFRQARVEKFVHTMRAGHLGDLPLAPLQITANFRSQRGLVEAFNRYFPLIFPAQRKEPDPGEVPYIAADPVRDASSKAELSFVWHTQVFERLADNEALKRRKRKYSMKQASEIRLLIEQWQARPLPEKRKRRPDGTAEPWKIAVLVRARTLLRDIVTELKTTRPDTQTGEPRQIPFRALNIEELGERQEVLDLLAITRAVLHPADRVAWLAILRAPWCGLSLAQLHLLSGQDDHSFAETTIERAIADRAELLPVEVRHRVDRVRTVMMAADEHAVELTMSQRVEKTWRTLGGDLYLSDMEMANVQRYLELLDEIEQQTGRVDLRLLRKRMSQLYAQAEMTEDAVDLMTIHGSKGLEWDFVIVSGLDKKEQSQRGRLLDWDEIEVEKRTSIMLAPIAGKREESKDLNKWLRRMETKRNAAELKRLFYVACTRAREELHLFASLDQRANGEIRPTPATLLDAAWPAAKEYFTEPGTPSKPARDYVLGIAAGADLNNNPKPPLLHRLPYGLDLEQRFTRGPRLRWDDSSFFKSVPRFERPRGSAQTRALGDVIHTFIDLMTKRIASGMDIYELRFEIASFQSRIGATLRAEGIQPSRVREMTQQVSRALEKMLDDDAGRWLLTARTEALSEFDIVSWQRQRSSFRLDRIFLAGPEPLSQGDEFLWIVDYKTATHGRGDIDEFLQLERTKYAAQLDAYASTFRTSGYELRLALYYPLLQRLIWWLPE